MRKTKLVLMLLVLCFMFPAAFSAAADSGRVPPAKGMVTMIDLGSERCMPCRLMAPFLEELRQEYKGKAAIIYVDVWEHPEQGRLFGVRAIPTQIFYDKKGNEVARHTGYLPKEAIVAMLHKLGAGK
jgi:thioredoxin 1